MMLNKIGCFIFGIKTPPFSVYPDPINKIMMKSSYEYQGFTFKGRDRAAPLAAPLKINKES